MVALTALLVLAARVVSAPRFDAGFAVQLHAGGGTGYDWAVPVTDLGGAPAIVAAVVIFGGLLVLRRHLRFAAVLGLAFVLSEGSAQVLKRVIERPRPGHPLVEDVFKRDVVSGFVAPKGANAALEQLGALSTRTLVPGSFAAVRLAPVAAPSLLAVYSEDVNEAARSLGLLPADDGANVTLLRPFDDVVWARASVVDDTGYAAGDLATLGVGAAVLAVACCAGGPLLIAAAGSLALGAWRGIGTFAVVLVGVVSLLVLRWRGRPTR